MSAWVCLMHSCHSWDCGFLGTILGFVLGEFGVFQLFLGFLTVSDMFSILKSFTIPCMHVHVYDVPDWLSSYAQSCAPSR